MLIFRELKTGRGGMELLQELYPEDGGEGLRVVFETGSLTVSLHDAKEADDDL